MSAAYKWIEFFPQYDLAWEFANARRVGKKMKRQIAEQCPRHVDKIRFWRGTYYLLAPCGAVFVVAKNEFIVDAFPINTKERFTAHMQKGTTQYLAARDIA